ncbi:hypothetical protein JXA56_01140 [Candidatus Micrarchaeota archaeon]|nr:hypothetical protein [Candidatus Micrarchaeota archaeon]
MVNKLLKKETCSAKSSLKGSFREHGPILSYDKLDKLLNCQLPSKAVRIINAHLNDMLPTSDSMPDRTERMKKKILRAVVFAADTNCAQKISIKTLAACLRSIGNWEFNKGDLELGSELRGLAEQLYAVAKKH